MSWFLPVTSYRLLKREISPSPGRGGGLRHGRSSERETLLRDFFLGWLGLSGNREGTRLAGGRSGSLGRV